MRNIIKNSLILLTVIISSVMLVACGGTGSDEVTELKFKDTMSIKELKKYDGKTVTMTGFMSTSTPLNGQYVYLMNMPYQNCAFCVPNSDTLVNTLAVYAKEGSNFEFTDVPVKIQGKLKFEKMTDSMGYEYEYRIVDATLEKADVSQMEDDIKVYTDLINLGFVNTMEAIFTDLYSALNYEEIGAEPEKIDVANLEKAKDMINSLDATKYTEISGVLDDIAGVIEIANKGVAEKDYSRFTLLNEDVQKAYMTYTNWLLKPEM